MIEQENIRLRLVWLNRWHTGFTGVQMWPAVVQALYDKDLARKRRKALDYLMLRRKVGYNVIPFPYRHFAGRLK